MQTQDDLFTLKTRSGVRLSAWVDGETAIVDKHAHGSSKKLIRRSKTKMDALLGLAQFRAQAISDGAVIQEGSYARLVKDPPTSEYVERFLNTRFVYVNVPSDVIFEVGTLNSISERIQQVATELDVAVEVRDHPGHLALAVQKLSFNNETALVGMMYRRNFNATLAMENLGIPFQSMFHEGIGGVTIPLSMQEGDAFFVLLLTLHALKSHYPSLGIFFDIPDMTLDVVPAKLDEHLLDSPYRHRIVDDMTRIKQALSAGGYTIQSLVKKVNQPAFQVTNLIF